MPLLELELDKAEALRNLLESRGHEVELVREERFFGDAQTATLVLEGSTALINLVAATVAAWSTARTVKSVVDGKPVTFDAAKPEDVASALASDELG